MHTFRKAVSGHYIKHLSTLLWFRLLDSQAINNHEKENELVYFEFETAISAYN